MSGYILIQKAYLIINDFQEVSKKVESLKATELDFKSRFVYKMSLNYSNVPLKSLKRSKSCYCSGNHELFCK